MSKMSDLHLELTEQANELGFESLGEAEQAGYGVDWKNRKLVDGRELAHKDWLKEKEDVLNRLKSVYADATTPIYSAMDIKRAIEFIERGEI